MALEDLPTRHRRALRSGRVRILTEEVPEAGCQRLRQNLAAYLEAPEAEQARFGMLTSPGAPLGTGCGGFALWLAGQGGALQGLGPQVMRPVTLRDSFAGTATRPPPEGISLPPMAPASPLPLHRLLGNDWTQGRILGEVMLFDMELLLYALDLGAGQPGRLDPGDPAVRALNAATGRWLAGHGRRTPVRVGAASAVILHRR